MSIRAWRAKYMPVQASEAISSDLEATLHSLQKWQGLTPEALKEFDLEVRVRAHGCAPFIRGSAGEVEFSPSARNCALCVRHSQACELCPILLVNGNLACCGHSRSQWRVWLNDLNPLPMIELLQKTVNKLNEQNEKDTGSVSQVGL